MKSTRRLWLRVFHCIAQRPQHPPSPRILSSLPLLPLSPSPSRYSLDHATQIATLVTSPINRTCTYFRASGPARLTDFVLCPAGSLSTSKAYCGTLTGTMSEEDNVGGRRKMTPTILSWMSSPDYLTLTFSLLSPHL